MRDTAKFINRMEATNLNDTINFLDGISVDLLKLKMTVEGALNIAMDEESPIKALKLMVSDVENLECKLDMLKNDLQVKNAFSGLMTQNVVKLDNDAKEQRINELETELRIAQSKIEDLEALNTLESFGSIEKDFEFISISEKLKDVVSRLKEIQEGIDTQIHSNCQEEEDREDDYDTFDFEDILENDESEEESELDFEDGLDLCDLGDDLF